MEEKYVLKTKGKFNQECKRKGCKLVEVSKLKNILKVIHEKLFKRFHIKKIDISK